MSAIVFAGTTLIRLLSSTWRFQRRNIADFEALRAQHEGFVFAIWHGEMLPLMCGHRGERIMCVVSEHRDGEIIARIATAFGVVPVRGSSTRGGARALLEIVRHLKTGAIVGITPDGPRGPRHSFAAGAVVAAARANVPIVAARAEADRAWHLTSWDAFMIPKPFARVTLTYSAMDRVRGEGVREAEADAPRFASMMNSLGSDE